MREGIKVNDDGSINITFASGSTVASPVITGSPQGVTYPLLTNGIAFIAVSSGSIANNGALSGITALPLTYSEGCYMLFPAGAIAAGVPAAAAWYWVVMSSTTAGTIYNSTYTSGIPAAGTQTAFATTGPGAFVGVSAETTSIQVTLSANSLGVKGKLRMFDDFQATNTAGVKTINKKFGGTTVQSSVATSQLGCSPLCVISNRGATNVQYTTGSGASGNGLGNNAGVRSAIDTTANVTVSVTLTNATPATNNFIHETAFWEILKP